MTRQFARSHPAPANRIANSSKLALSRGRNAMSIWQDLVDQHGFTGAYESVKRFVRKLRGTQPPEARAVIQTAPGEEAQVDYGTGPMVRDPQTGKYRRTRLFVLTLGFSRKCVRLLVLPFQRAHLGRTARAGLPPAGWSDASRGARQPEGRRALTRTSTIPRSIRSIATCWLTTAPSPCRAAFRIRIEKARWNPASATPRRRR